MSPFAWLYLNVMLVLTACKYLQASYLSKAVDLPEDELVEFCHVDSEGSAFVLGTQSAFEAQRLRWRSNSHKVQLTQISSESVDKIVFSTKNGTFTKRIPLQSFLLYLAKYWPTADEDYPSPKKLAEMNMGELVAGADWKLLENN